MDVLVRSSDHIGSKRKTYMRTARIFKHEEIEFNYDICNIIWEAGCGEDIEGKMVDMGFWKMSLNDDEMFEDLFGGGDLAEVARMAAIAEKYDDDDLVEF